MNPGILKLYKRWLVGLVWVSFFALPAFGAEKPSESLANLGFSIHKLGSGQGGHTVLVIGGIQGDEPGGFNAASLIVTHYEILTGNVWVVPNLNFLSIIKRSRGVYGDLNRKFDEIHPDDPEYRTIRRIKKLIVDPGVDMILNLHDGSGFFRPAYQDKLRNPDRWGQCIIVDQSHIEAERFANLSQMAKKTITQVNDSLLAPGEGFHLKNTRTRNGNAEMAKTLTYFAIKNKKSAFGIEASKSFLTPKRAYYHLLAVESFFRQAGIRFKRRFSLSQARIKKAIHDNIQVALNHQKILLTVENVRTHLKYIPLEKDNEIEFKANHPLMTIIGMGNTYSVFHGNRRLTRLSPQYFEYDFSLDAIEMIIDGRPRRVPFGNIVSVKDRFEVKQTKDHRVNIIGFTLKGISNESGIPVTRNKINKAYSINQTGSIFRVEVYKSHKFSGMVLVDFKTKEMSGFKVAFEEERKNRSKNLF